MDKQFKQAKRQLLEEELSDFTFTSQMKNNILNEIQSKKVTKKKQQIIPILLTACFFGAFSVGIYEVIQNQEGNGKNSEGVEEPTEIEQPKEDIDTPVPQLEKEPVVTEDEPVEDKTEVPVKEETESVPEETKEESVTEEPTTQEPVIEDTASYFDEEFMNQLKQGLLKGTPISFDSRIGDVKALYGEPQSFSSIEGAYLIVYDQFEFVYPYGKLNYKTKEQVTNDVPIIGMKIKLKEPNFFSDMRKVLGEPEWSGLSELDGQYYYSYHFNDYKINASSGKNGGEETPINYIIVTMKNNE